LLSTNLIYGKCIEFDKDTLHVIDFPPACTILLIQCQNTDFIKGKKYSCCKHVQQFTADYNSGQHESLYAFLPDQVLFFLKAMPFCIHTNVFGTGTIQNIPCYLIITLTAS